MSDLELLRRAYPEPGSPAEDTVRAAAEQALATHIADHERRTRRRPARRRWLLGIPAVAVTAGIALVIVLAGSAGDRASEASAAQVLHGAAAAARAGVPTRQLRPGQYLYTRSENAWLSTSNQNGREWAALVPQSREVWLSRDGTGWLRQRSGSPQLLSDADRAAWTAAGRPRISNDMNVPLRNEDGRTPPMASLRLPDDAKTLREHLVRAAGTDDPVQLFERATELLFESYTTPAQRAALYDVTADLDGVHVIGTRRDGAGRIGTAVAIDDPANHIRSTLIFDRRTEALLGHELTVLPGAHRYAAGTRIGWSAVLQVEVVDKIKHRPVPR